ncbi:MAG: DEAD/DEAH box helicase [Firmicutes bacterium ADurb.Bin182]|nr:MAG: DEAD/DEAH box helicase [Firmicutes bacterium ADurb.Bin182]
MNNIPYARIDKAGKRRQPLAEHGRNVAAFMRNTCESAGLSAIGELTGLVHDLGKACSRWQIYLFDPDPPETVPHARAAAQWFWIRYRSQTDYFGQVTARIITIAIYGHHAGLPDIISPDGQRQFFLSLLEDSPAQDAIVNMEQFLKDAVGLEHIDALFDEAIIQWKSLFDRLMAGVPLSTQLNAKANYLMMLVGLTARYLYACLIDADRFDAACWEEEKKADYPEPYTDLWDALIPIFEANLEKKSVEQAKRAAPGIHNYRRKISEQCREFAAHGSGVYRLYAPTGSGKCLSSLRYALHHAALHKKKRILFVIPYLTVLDQNAKEIRGILGDPDDLILELHSNIIPDEENDKSKEEKLPKLRTERLESPIVITTVVQLLNTLFLGRAQSARRLQALADAVLIIDEAQALPAYCISLFNVAMTFLSMACNTTVLLCTATQPTFAQTAYPLRLSEPTDLVEDYEEAFHAFSRTQIINLCKPGGHTCAEIAALAAEQCATHGSALVVMNTKRGVRRVYEALSAMETGYTLYYLTTELCAAHRLETVEKIRCGLDGDPPVPLIVISTSLIEFGMDLSFGCAIRSFAGEDSLVQVSGRCNRHGEQVRRPVILLRCSEENIGRLSELIRATTSMDRVLSDWKGREEELLSPEAIQQYYLSYFKESERVLNWPVSEAPLQGQTLCDYLGVNRKALDEKPILEPPMLPHQSFRTAGEKFYVIHDNTTGVIVPWEKGESLIVELGGASEVEKKKKLLRQAQRYTVSLYQNKFAELLERKAIFLIEEVDAYALRPELYHEVFGVTLSPNGNPDDYMF